MNFQFRVLQRRPGEWFLYVDEIAVYSVPWWLVDQNKEDPDKQILAKYLGGLWLEARLRGYDRGQEDMKSQLRDILT